MTDAEMKKILLEFAQECNGYTFKDDNRDEFYFVKDGFNVVKIRIDKICRTAEDGTTRVKNERKISLYRFAENNSALKGKNYRTFVDEIWNTEKEEMTDQGCQSNDSSIWAAPDFNHADKEEIFAQIRFFMERVKSLQEKVNQRGLR